MVPCSLTLSDPGLPQTTPFCNFGLLFTSLEQVKLQTSNFVHSVRMAVLANEWLTTSMGARKSQVTFSNFWALTLALYQVPMRFEFAIWSELCKCTSISTTNYTTFTVRCYARTIYAVALYLSIRLSQAGIILKWLDVKSYKQCQHTNNATW